MVPGVHEASDLFQVRTHLVGRPGLRRVTDHLREAQQALRQLALALPSQLGQVGLRGVDRFGLDTGSLEDTAHASVRVLDLVDRVGFRSIQREIEIEAHRHLGPAHEEEVTGHVYARFLEELSQGYELPGTLAHPHLLAASHYRHELDDQCLEEIRRQPESLQRGPHAGDVSVVIGPPHIDREIEAARALVDVVGDVGQEVGEGAVALHEHPVLVIAEASGAQPGGAALGIGEVLRLQALQGIPHFASLVEAALLSKHLHVDSEILQVPLLRLTKPPGRERSEALHPLLATHLRQLLGSHFRRGPLGELLHVLSHVAAVRHFGLLTGQLTKACLQGCGQ